MGIIMMQLSQARAKIIELESEVEQLRLGILTPPEAPTVKGAIPAQEIHDLLTSIFPEQMDKVHLADQQYEITAISEIRRFIEWDNVNIFPYIAEIHDCDDFALALAGDFAKYPEWSGFPVAKIHCNFLGGHAFILAIAWPSFEDMTPTVYYVEPQNDHEIAEEMMEGVELWLLSL